MISKTSNLAEVRKHPRRYTWGPVSEILDIGPYTILVYQGEKNGGPDGETYYHAFVDGKDTNASFPSLDGALLGAMAYRRLGWSEGHYAASFALRVLTPMKEGV